LKSNSAEALSPWYALSALLSRATENLYRCFAVPAYVPSDVVPIAASVPEYFWTSSPSPQTFGVLASVQRPQSVTITFSFAASGFVLSEFVSVPRASVNVLLSEPLFWMSTLPV